MAISLISRFRQTEISRTKAIAISVFAGVVFVLLGLWLFGGPSHSVPPIEQVKAHQLNALKAMAGGQASADAALKSSPAAKP